jgi:hypothetical protein
MSLAGITSRCHVAVGPGVSARHRLPWPDARPGGEIFRARGEGMADRCDFGTWGGDTPHLERVARFAHYQWRDEPA